jgi:hypothetical protein
MNRQTWHVDHLDIVDEPMILSLLKYKHYEDRQPSDVEANVVSSDIVGSKLHAPIIDLDFDHAYVPSTTPGHAHLYLNVPISRWRLFVLLWGLRVGGVIEKGNFWWSLRRGGTYVRRPHVKKTPEEAAVKYTYGMFFKLPKDQRHG